MTGSTVKAPIVSAKGAFGLSAQPIEFLQRHIKLSENLEEQRRANLTSAMQRDGDRPPVRLELRILAPIPGFGKVARRLTPGLR